MPQASEPLLVYVLHRQPYRESSYLMDLWTREQGRLRVIAKSARGPRSRFRGQLEPFTPIQCRLAGRHTLKVIAEADVVGLPLDFPGKALFCAFYLNELILRLCPLESASPTIFESYRETLIELSQHNILTPLRHFELTLLTALGYGMELSHDTTGDTVLPDSVYSYESDQGFIRVDSDDSAAFFSGELLLLLSEGQAIPDRLQQQAKRLMRQALRPHLGDQPLKSQAAFGTTSVSN